MSKKETVSEKKVCVIYGIYGTLGVPLGNALHELGYKVVGIDSNVAHEPTGLLNTEILVHHGDSVFNNVPTDDHKIDIVINLTGRFDKKMSPVELVTGNIMPVINIIQNQEFSEKFINVTDFSPKNKIDWTIYDYTKQHANDYVISLLPQEKRTIVRLPELFGEKRNNGTILDLLNSKDKTIVVDNDKQEFLHVGDAVGVIIKAVEEKHVELYGVGYSASQLDLVTQVRGQKFTSAGRQMVKPTCRFRHTVKRIKAKGETPMHYIKKQQ